MSFFLLLLSAFLPLLALAFPSSSGPMRTSSRWSSTARLVLRGPEPSFNGWFSTYPSVPSRSISLSGLTSVCPADFPWGFYVVCDPASAGASKATFRVGPYVVKVATRTWFGPFAVAGHFRAGNVVWQGWATGKTVTCSLDNGEVAKATIRVAC